MDFILNDCSLHGQFATPTAFFEALRRVLELRSRLHRSGRVLRCPRKLLEANVGASGTLQQALNSTSDRNLHRVIMTWLANEGPFWDDEPLHSQDDYFDLKDDGTIVTETGLGEAAMSALKGLKRSLLSFDPSSWTHSPIEVDHVRNDSSRQTITLNNYWSLPELERHLQSTRPPLTSWSALVQWAREECPLLTLTPDVIRWLDGHPFIRGAAERFQVLLSTLDTLRGSFGEDGSLNERGKEILKNHFTGEKAWFSDSSDGEKSAFRDELTFPNPGPNSTTPTVFCPWHGKVKIEQMRVHFTYPIRHDRPVYIVYIGPKLTKR